MQTILINAQTEKRVNKKFLEKITHRALKALKISSASSLSITFVNRHDIRRLNKRYFKKSCSTDVIAFEYLNKKARQDLYKSYLGDVIICPEVAYYNAKLYDNSFLRELTLYIIHGILHLLGYDDTTSKKKAIMQKKQKEVLEKLWR